VDLVTDADTGNQSNQKAGGLFVNQLAEVLHIPVQNVLDCVLDVVMFDWKNHPSVQGGYAYSRVGMTTTHLEALAAPMGPIMFAKLPTPMLLALYRPPWRLGSSGKESNELFEE
jgi:hypothetical protein